MKFTTAFITKLVKDKGHRTKVEPRVEWQNASLCSQSHFEVLGLIPGRERFFSSTQGVWKLKKVGFERNSA